MLNAISGALFLLKGTVLILFYVEEGRPFVPILFAFFAQKMQKMSLEESPVLRDAEGATLSLFRSSQGAAYFNLDL